MILWVPISRGRGASREPKKDYLHFLYIARGSLNEARYFLHLSARLHYLSDADCQRLEAQAEETMRTLSGLIKSVESEVGLVGRAVARASGVLVLSLAWSVVCGLRSFPQP